MDFKRTSDEIASMLELKDRMYGKSFDKTLNEYGDILICIRLEDKLNRLKQIILKREEDLNTNEKLEDTLKDLAGYAILSLIAIRKVKKKWL